MKKRNILVMYILSIITLGIYSLYWYCSVQNEIKAKTGEGFGGFGHFMASLFTFGIYPLYWYYVIGGRLERIGASNYGWLYLLLCFTPVGIINMGLIQHQVNKTR